MTCASGFIVPILVFIVLALGLYEKQVHPYTTTKTQRTTECCNLCYLCFKHKTDRQTRSIFSLVCSSPITTTSLQFNKLPGALAFLLLPMKADITNTLHQENGRVENEP